MADDFPTYGERMPARDAYVRENLLINYDLVEPLEKIELLLHAGEIDAAAEALSDFIRPRHRAPLSWSRARRSEETERAA